MNRTNPNPTNEHTTTNSKSVIQTTANSRPVRVRTDAEGSITTTRHRGIAQISGPNHSRVAKQLASNVASVAPVTRAAGNDGVRRGCRQFFRRRAIVDRSGENRDGNDIVDPDLPAEPVHFHMPEWDRCSTANRHGCVICSRQSGRAALNRIRAGRLDLFTINGLRRVHGCAAHWSVGDRDYVWFRLLEAMGHLLGCSARTHLKLWSVIFVVVCLQMMTTLRPIVGTSDHLLPSEKKFFLAHWVETLRDESTRK